MIQDKFGQLIFNEYDIINLVMQGRDISTIDHMLVDKSVDLKTASLILENIPKFIDYDELPKISINEFDHCNQNNWHMPEEYKHIDIAQHVLNLCKTDAEMQRCGQELLLYQERNLFDLLRFLKYLVDVMTENRVIWGVGRGSSVASYVLYKLEVHRIDSMFYDLDPHEFLR